MTVRSNQPGFSVKTALALAALVAMLALASTAVKPPSAQASCGVLRVGGNAFVFYKHKLTCKKAMGLARQTYKRNKAPNGYKCPDSSPGHNRRDGAQCAKIGNANKYFGYNVAD